MTPGEHAEYVEKLRSLRFGTPRQPRVHIDRENDTKIVEVVRDDDGSSGGFHTMHADGTQDATVMAPVIESTSDVKPVG